MKRWEERDARHSPAKRSRSIKFNCTRKGEAETLGPVSASMKNHPVKDRTSYV
jgi:hypothetical protein